jgi:hypothetical protein
MNAVGIRSNGVKYNKTLKSGVLNTMRVDGSPLTTEAEFDMMAQAVREQIAQDIINEYDLDTVRWLQGSVGVGCEVA